jgi:hypothetical protein
VNKRDRTRIDGCPDVTPQQWREANGGASHPGDVPKSDRIARYRAEFLQRQAADAASGRTLKPSPPPLAAQRSNRMRLATPSSDGADASPSPGLRDLFGRPIPEAIFPAFEREYIAGAFYERFSRVRSFASTLRPFVEPGRFAALTAQLESAGGQMVLAIESGYPCVCPACDGHDDRRGTCVKCGGQGYLPNARLIAGRTTEAAADRAGEMLESAADRIDEALAEIRRWLPSSCCRQCFGTGCKTCGALGVLPAGASAETATADTT